MDHPIWSILEHQERTLRWLGRRTGFSEDLVYAVKMKRRRASPAFRARCAEVMDLPEAVLFHANGSSASLPDVSPTALNDRAGTAVGQPIYGSEEAPSIRISA